ncbi:ABC transporter permease [Enterococcus rivorum]|uniref:Branched-chain amino acid ABC transporter permease n=2 Tax=Enterococcus rivorum TaxID=762845 RepID=A0A1E5KSQ3_9ENTE|nr:ABC transporter permease [Enterococcus rivorum]MBP2098192.1 simple sugar transport system permease protein [Enterococcus rivorum]OEH80886.1 branched-chain amino acid ABC transporter permease [Enterococcus rivorum]
MEQRFLKKYDFILIPLIAIILGLLLGAVMMLIGGYDPLLAYGSLIKKIVGTSYDLGEAFRTVVPLVMSGLAVAVASHAGLFNIGVDGQIIMGSLGALIVGTQVQLPPFLHGLLAMVVGGLFGALWGGLVGYLKAKRGINEVISSIMLNFIALYLSHYLIRLFMDQPGTQRSTLIKDSASINIGWLSERMGGARVHWGFIIMLFAVLAYHIYLNRSKSGYEIRAVGLNPFASKYAGMKVPAVMIRAMMISGLIGGLIGSFEVLGVFKYIAINSTTSGIGFDGIAVSLLGGGTGLGILLSGTLIGLLTYGAQGMSFGAGVPREIINMVIAFIIFFVAASGIVRSILYLFGKNKQPKEG